MNYRSRQTETAVAQSRDGMVTTPHWAASEAGAKVLARGGNAIEALVAAGGALSVTYPHFCGLGGDAVWMVCDRDGDAHTFLGIGQAAASAHIDGPIPPRGPASTLTTACLVDSWEKVLDHSATVWGGSEQLATLLDDAIALADDGFAISPSQTFWHNFRAGESETWPGFRELFQRDGIQRQPALAQTLKAIAANGAREFYEGALADRIARGLAATGSPLTAADLAATRTGMVEPVRLSYGDTVLLAPPPPTQGVTTLGIMAVLSQLAPKDKSPDSAAYYHALVEAVKQAFLDRHLIADPEFGADATRILLDPDRLSRKAAAVDPNRAAEWPAPYRQGDTALLAAVDADGRAACLLQSIYFDWGSGVVAGDTGILWQNRGAAFSVDPPSPNFIQPGKRPFYTLNPGLALKNGRPHLVYGTQGADGQPQTLALLLSLLIDHGFDPLTALSRPRFLLGRTFSDSRDNLKIEENVGADTLAALGSLGHEVATIAPLSPLGGQAGIIRIQEDGQMEAAHDPRSDGGAIGL
ncbi:MULTISPECIES: gamma-glutamyltransferase family protein [unclassified Rhizobium]|uniref:gamma-glutamyltransferase family protein n=1 Tax=unclassified Rhizobium TaxID=2613769 RepID=UPI001ADB256E|nr:MULTISPECIES: gamma-glutamyltransferase family protein [unclassified Rhizobium]MBO9126719.1 gamma-glutamyltransferase family protein [Rhizobium sp. 16-488-2b]MBO9177166.1 gamma-glutamyltransferase family protein [Rhizobium sp. 16-488-2a]